MTRKQWCGVAVLILWLCMIAVIGSVAKGIPLWEGFAVVGIIIGCIVVPLFGLSLLID